MAKRSGGKHPIRGGPENPQPPENWLPPGWIVEGKMRQSGLAAGQIYKYYTDPISKRKFRSKKEVLNFLGSGAVPVVTPNKKRKDNASDVKDSPESPAMEKLKKSFSTSKTKTFKFDFSDVPQKINWILTDTYMECWTPFAENEKVAESIAQEWIAASTYLIVGKTSPPML